MYNFISIQHVMLLLKVQFCRGIIFTPCHQGRRKPLRRQSIGRASDCWWTMVCPSNALFAQNLPTPLHVTYTDSMHADSPYDLLRTRVQKKRRKGSVLDIRRRKASSTFLLKKGCFFSSLSPFRGPISQSRFRGVLTSFSRGYNLKDWSSINFPFYMFIWCLIPCRAHLLTDNDI